ncbi:hypothetical protein NL676_002482 [Syzygium grande]|nr:hypothetical protein NL676_002482 [Syzygium grande]
MIRRRDHGLQRESSSLFGLRLSIPLSSRAGKTTGDHQIERKRKFLDWCYGALAPRLLQRIAISPPKHLFPFTKSIIVKGLAS